MNLQGAYALSGFVLLCLSVVFAFASDVKSHWQKSERVLAFLGWTSLSISVLFFFLAIWTGVVT